VGFDGSYILYITTAEHETSLKFNIVVLVVLCVTNVSGKLKCLNSEKYSSLKDRVVFNS
jgi:hypothetical protein